MKTNKIIVMLVMLLFISGCGSFKKEYTPTITSKDIYTGKDGLRMEFFENTPPKEIFENSPLPIGLKIYNEGAYDIENGYLSISLEKDYMSLDEASLRSINDMFNFKDPQHIQFSLKGKTIEHPKGEQDVVTFNAKTTENLSKIDPQSEYHNSLISITSCYKYQTKAVETVCIDTDVYGFKQREKSCKVEAISLSSQGAPVAVTKIESEMVPSTDDTSIIKPRFIITVKNLGNGEVIREDKVEGACSSERLGQGEWNNIKVKAYISTMTDEKNKLDCNIIGGDKYDNGTLILKQKEDSIRCSYEEGFKQIKGTFSSPLYIILDYGYTDTISKDVKIRKVVTN